MGNKDKDSDEIQNILGEFEAIISGPSPAPSASPPPPPPPPPPAPTPVEQKPIELKITPLQENAPTSVVPLAAAPPEVKKPVELKPADPGSTPTKVRLFLRPEGAPTPAVPLGTPAAEAPKPVLPEIQLGPPPSESAKPGAPALPGVSPPVIYKPVPGGPPPPVAGLIVVRALKNIVPPQVPREQVRRVAFIHLGVHAEKCDQFIDFVGSVAIDVGKKPLYIEHPLVAQIASDSDFQDLVVKVHDAKVIAVVGLVTGMPWLRLQDLKEAFGKENIPFHMINTEDTQKRPIAVDLVVELTLQV